MNGNHCPDSFRGLKILSYSTTVIKNRSTGRYRVKLRIGQSNRGRQFEAYKLARYCRSPPTSLPLRITAAAPVIRRTWCRGIIYMRVVKVAAIKRGVGTIVRGYDATASERQYGINYSQRSSPTPLGAPLQRCTHSPRYILFISRNQAVRGRRTREMMLKKVINRHHLHNDLFVLP